MRLSNAWVIFIAFVTYVAIIDFYASAASLSKPSLKDNYVQTNHTNTTSTTEYAFQDQTKHSKFVVRCENWKNACKLNKAKTDYKMSCSKAVKRMKYVKGKRDFMDKVKYCYSCRRYVCNGGAIVG